ALQAYWILYAGFVALPLITGIDKFFDFMTQWDEYLTPLVPQIMHMTSDRFMMIVGVIEIMAALVVAFRPYVGAYIVTLWLYGIIVNLLMTGFYDIALRDFGLSLAAVALARLSREYGR